MDLSNVLIAHKIIRLADTVPPNPITQLTATATSYDSVTLTWLNPLDSEFAGVKIVRKVGSMPTSITDGKTVYAGIGTATGDTVTLKGYAPSVRSYVDTTVSAETTYYYRAFTYGVYSNYNKTESDQVATTTTPPPYELYGFAVDETNSDPATCVTYIENAVGMTPATNVGTGNFNGGDWLDAYPFNAIRPVSIDANGDIIAEVAPTNFTRTPDGVSLTTEQKNYVMIEIPPVYWKFTKTANGYEVRWSDVKIDNDYQALAHERGGVLKGNLYVSAYEGFVENSKLLSITGKTPTVTTQRSAFITSAKAVGSGFDIMNFHTVTLLQILFVTMFKTLDSQTALGRGISNRSSLGNTGIANTVGMYYGNPAGNTAAVKFMGIENLWGNAAQWLYGARVTGGTRCSILGNEVLTSGEGTQYSEKYTFATTGTGTVMAGYMNEVAGTQIGAFLPKGVQSDNGSSSTYYCDRVGNFDSTTSTQDMYYGGAYYAPNQTSTYFAGIFAISSYSSSSSLDYVGARLQYLAP